MRRMRNRLMLGLAVFTCATVVLACGHRCYRHFCCPPPCIIMPPPCVEQSKPKLEEPKHELLPMPKEEIPETASLPGAYQLSDLTTGHSILFPDTLFPTTYPPFTVEFPPIIFFPPIVDRPPEHFPPVTIPHPPSVVTPVPPSLVLFGTGAGLVLASQVWSRWRRRSAKEG